jgi:hypothetical protein
MSAEQVARLREPWHALVRPTALAIKAPAMRHWPMHGALCTRSRHPSHAHIEELRGPCTFLECNRAGELGLALDLDNDARELNRGGQSRQEQAHRKAGGIA